MEKLKKQQNRKAILIGLGIAIIILVLITLIFGFGRDKDEQREIETNKNGEQSERGVLGNLSIIIPEAYETSESNNKNYKRYSKSEENEYCYVVFKRTEQGSYESGKDYLEKNIYIELEDKENKYKEKKIGEAKWASISIATEEGSTEYYAIKEANEIYSVEYYVAKNSKKCQEEKEEMIKTMEMANAKEE